MQNVKLIIGSKSRSSWSLRPWLFLRHHGVRFEEIEIALGRRDTRSRLLEHSPSGKVPCLHHDGIRVWESLAICEYAAETFALPRAWPIEPQARALARAMATEMHAGFADLRRELPFDARRNPAPTTLSEAATADVQRIRVLWRQARSQHGQGGPWLFGQFGIVDAMFAPVALRFQQYAVPLDGPELQYQFQVLMHPSVQEWLEQADQGEDEPEWGALEPPVARTQELPGAATAARRASEAVRAASQATSALDVLAQTVTARVPPPPLAPRPTVVKATLPSSQPEPGEVPKLRSVILPP